MGPAVLAPAWQQPHVNIFKLCDVENNKEVDMQGDVKEFMDRIIGKKVFKIRGLIPAANFLRVPKLRSQTLGLTGRFLYMQIKVTPVRVFVIHLEVVTADLIVHRVSISSMYRSEQLRRKSNGIQIPFPQASHRWCILAVDLAQAVSKYSRSPFHSLRSVELCSWLTVRSMYTSDLKFSLQSLPRDMALSHALDTSVFELLWLPAEPTDVQEADTIPVVKPPMGTPHRITADTPRTMPGPGRTSTSPPSVPPGSPNPKVPAIPPVFDKSVNAPAMSQATKRLAGELAQQARVPSPRLKPESTLAHNLQVVPGLHQHQYGKSQAGRLVSDTGPSDQAVAHVHDPLSDPDPALTLARVDAFSGDLPRTLVWPPHSQEVVFAAASVVVAMKADGTAQRFFLGHTSHVVAIAFDGEGAIMATAQDGKQAIIRVWAFHSRQCIAILNGHASGLQCVDISQDGRALVGVGLDAATRQMMVLWDISQLRYGGKPEVVARHTTEYNIKAIKFSAYEEDQLVTCGRDNVRTYRLKGNQLRGVTVRIGAPDKKVMLYAGGLTAALGPNVFTDIAFESSVGLYNPELARHVFVASASGALFRIDYAARTLLCVYQLHSAAINSIAMHQGFCVTASDDRLLRVWPMDFTDYLMQAEHEASVTSVAVSPDGLRVAIGTESCSLGVLDVPSHNYVTLLRSHLACVNAVAVHPTRNEYCTVSDDGTIRIWDLDTHQQRVEFDAPGEQVLCVAYHPTHHELACGFSNGRLRVFDVDTTSLIQEHQQHRAALTHLEYAPDASRLYTAGADGGLCVYDVPHVYQPTKFLSAGMRDVKACLAVSPDGRFLACVSHDPYRSVTSILLFHGSTLDPYMRIETDTPAFKRLCFSPDSSCLWALSAPDRLDKYELQQGQLIMQVSGAHRLDVHALCVDPLNRFAVTGGADGLIKVWSNPRTPPHAAAALAAHRGAAAGGGGGGGGTGQAGSRRSSQEPGGGGGAPGGVPTHQAFSGHPSAIMGCAAKGNCLITVGDSASVMVWHVNYPVPSVTATTATGTTSGRGVRSGVSSTQYQAAEPHASLTTNTRSLAGLTLTSAGSRHIASTLPTTTTSLPAPSSPGPTSVLHTTSLAFPAQPPDCVSLLGYTPNGLTQNVVWNPDCGLFVYAVDHLVVIEDLVSHTQTYLSHFTQPVSALAASPDSQLVAAAPAACESSMYAEVVVWHVPTGHKLAALQYHPVAVEVLSFSPDSRHLISVGRDPERAIVVWCLDSIRPDPAQDPAHPPTPPPLNTTTSNQCIAGVGRTRRPTVSISWLPTTNPSTTTAAGSVLDGSAVGPSTAAAPPGCPRFMSAGEDGLMLWSVKSDCLEQVPVQLPVQQGVQGGTSCLEQLSPRGQDASDSTVAATALVVDTEGVAIVADVYGNVWEVTLGDAGLACIRHMAHIPGCGITRLAAGSRDTAAVGTLGGLLTLFSRASSAGRVWTRLKDLHLDGSITALCFEPSMRECVAATTTCTVWYCNMADVWRVPLVGGHAAPVTQLVVPRSSVWGGRRTVTASLMLSAAQDGALRVWKLDQQVDPIAEFQSGGTCTCAVFTSPLSTWRTSAPTSTTASPRSPSQPADTRPPAACIVGGYEDGSLRLFTLVGDKAGLQWRSVRHQRAVVGLAVHPGGEWLLSASCDGGLAVTHLPSSRLEVYLEHFITGSAQQLAYMPQLAVAASSAATVVATTLGAESDNQLCSLDVSAADATVCAVAWRTHFVVFSTPWDDSEVHLISMYKCEPSAGAHSTDVPAVVQFVPQSTKCVAYSSPLLLGKVLLFDYRVACVVRSVSLSQMVRCMAASPDGTLVAAGGMGGSVYLVDLATGRWKEMPGHRGHVVSAAFSHDCRRLVSCTGRVMQVWSLEGRMDIPTQQVRESKLLAPVEI